MGEGQEDEMILSTLKEMEQLSTVMGEMKRAGRTGNIDKLEKIGIEPMKQDYPNLYRALLVERNNDWIPKIEAFLNSPEIEFILVGALHLAGEKGIISQLEKLAYQVERF
jgi:uncharacterized protein YbaP (TraB family)